MSEKPDRPPEDPSWHYPPGFTLAIPSPRQIVLYASALGIVALWIILVIACILALVKAF